MSEVMEFLTEFDSYGAAEPVRSYKPIACPTWSPWGQPDANYQVFSGVWSISTPRHGGFYVSAERRKHMPAEWLALSFNGQAAQGWFEEDIDWCMVALAFPEEWKVFRGEAAMRDLEMAQKTLNEWILSKRKAG